MLEGRTDGLAVLEVPQSRSAVRGYGGSLVTVRFAVLPLILFKVRRIYCCVLKTTVTVIIALRERPKRFVLAVSNRELKYNMIPLPFL
jgi:hypothetical protein